jgi:hypothetical protein
MLMNKRKKVLAVCCCLLFIVTSFSVITVSKLNDDKLAENEKKIEYNDLSNSGVFDSVSSDIFYFDSSCDCLLPNSNLPIVSFKIKAAKQVNSVVESSIYSKSEILSDSDKSIFSVPLTKSLVSFNVGEDFFKSSLVSFEDSDQLGSLSISCSGFLFSEESYVRLMVYDVNGDVFLIFSTDSFGLSKGAFSVDNVALETVVVDGFEPMFLIVEVSGAVVRLDSLYGVIYDDIFVEQVLPLRNEIRGAQEQTCVRIWDDLIDESGMLWYAGCTEISRMSFAEKSRLFEGNLPNLFGFEYYTGGYFSAGVPDKGFNELSGESNDLDEYFTLSSWDWRNRHDADSPDSSYFKYRQEDFYFKNDIHNTYGMNKEMWAANNRVLHIGDFNGDDRDDILLQSGNEEYSTLLLIGQPNNWSFFEDVTDITDLYAMNAEYWSAESHVLHVGDFNGDGLDDVVLQNIDEEGRTYFLQARMTSGENYFHSVVDITDMFDMSGLKWSANQQVLHVGDFNGDGCDDILLQNIAIDGNTYMLQGKPTTASDYFYDAANITTLFHMSSSKWSDYYRMLHIGDFNGDGCEDVLLQNRPGNYHSSYMLFGTSNGLFTDNQHISDKFNMTRSRWAAESHVVYVGDFNGDGCDDIFLQNKGGFYEVLLLIANKGELGSIGDSFNDVVDVTDLFGMSAECWSDENYVLHVGDFNVDGRHDIFLQNIGGDDFPFLLYGRDSGLFSKRITIEDGYFGMSRNLWGADKYVTHVGSFNHVHEMYNESGYACLLLQNIFDTGVCRLVRGRSLQPSGWMPPRYTTQMCGHCWAFAPVYALQSRINLYLNTMLDVDLSERHIVQCKGWGCHGGDPKKSFEHICNTGILLEEDFSYFSSGDEITDEFTPKTVHQFCKNGLSFNAESPDYGGKIHALAQDDMYVYAAGEYDRVVQRFSKESMAFIDETRSYDYGISGYRRGGIYCITQDDDFIYAAGQIEKYIGNENWEHRKGNVSKYSKSDMSFVDETFDLGSAVYSVLVDDEFLYASAYDYVLKFQKSDLSFVSRSDGYNGTIHSLVQDDMYVYAAGLQKQNSRIYQYLKSDMSKVAESEQCGGRTIYALAIDDMSIYATDSDTGRIYQFWKNTLELNAQSVSYGGTVYALAVDDFFVYAAGDSVRAVKCYFKETMTFVGESDLYASNFYASELYETVIRALLVDDSFMYAAGEVPQCPTIIDDLELIKADGYVDIGSYQQELDLKRNIVSHGPGSIAVSPWGHAMAVVGFDTVVAGEIIQKGNIPHTGTEIIVEPDSPFIGKTYWIFEQSWGSWGYPKTPYTYVISTSSASFGQSLFFSSPISSKFLFSEADRIVRDEDGDGYYTWGIGEKPKGYDDIPDEQDGNDNDPKLGPINDLFQCSVVGKNIVVYQKEKKILGLGRYDFGRPAVGQQSTRSFTISNPGDKPLVLTGSPFIDILNDKENIFTVIKQPSSSIIQPGASDSFTIMFTGSPGGLFKAVVCIPNNDEYAGDYSFRLYGYGNEAYNKNTGTWYYTIQEAIHAAQHGNTIVVPGGEYYPSEEIIIDKGVTLVSDSGADVTIINAMNPHENQTQQQRVFYMNHQDAAIIGFTIINGQATYGGGIYVWKGGLIQSCKLLNNVASSGGGIYIDNSNILISNCVIRDNIARRSGGGIYFKAHYTHNKQCNIFNSIIDYNLANVNGGGIALAFKEGCSGNSVFIQNCLIHDNAAKDNGGGMSSSGYPNPSNVFKIDLTTIADNVALTEEGGGIFGQYSTSLPLVTNSIIYNNNAFMSPNSNNYNEYVPNDMFSYTCTLPLPEGVGNIDSNPRFNLNGLYPYMLRRFSPCINAGDPDDLSSFPDFDLAGNSRVYNGRVDMGAYEYQRNDIAESEINDNPPPIE